MSQFLDKFPRISYDINGILDPSYTTVTNVMFRIGFVKEVLNNVAAYYEYVIEDGDTPEILAERIYGNPEAHWMILYANNIYDPQYDWPLNYDQFKKYIIAKYGSEANAKTTIHHYEKIIAREVNNSGIVMLDRYRIDYEPLTGSTPDGAPHDTYVDLPVEPSYQTFNINGKTVVEGVSRAAISNYDYELAENEKKRQIKIIKKDYYSQITFEFRDLLGAEPSYLRRLT